MRKNITQLTGHASNMHICFVNMPQEYYSPVSGGAISTIIMQSAQELLRRGHQVTVLTITGQGETYAVGDVVALRFKTRKDLNFLQRRLSGLKGRWRGYDWPLFDHYLHAVTRALRALSSPPDIVIVFNDLVSPRRIGRTVPGAKIIVWLQNECRTRQKSLQATVNATHRFVTCSAYIRDWTARAHSIPRVKFTVALSGVDLDVFCPRENYLMPCRVLRTLFIGRIDPNKGPDIALDAIKRLQHENVPISITVAGGLWFYGHGREMEDPYFRDLKARMEDVDAEYLGHVTRDRVPSVVRSHDVSFVLSRANEPFGLVSLEAMASGCAVIASDRGGLPEACGGVALLVNPDDTEAIVEHLRRLAQDTKFLQQQKQRAVDRAQHASWSHCVDQLEAALLS